MNWKELENSIGEVLFQQKATLNEQAFWLEIESSVDAINADKRKRRGLIFWWTGSSIILSIIILIGLSYFWGVSSQNLSQTTCIINPPNEYKSYSTQKEVPLITESKIFNHTPTLSDDLIMSLPTLIEDTSISINQNKVKGKIHNIEYLPSHSKVDILYDTTALNVENIPILPILLEPLADIKKGIDVNAIPVKRSALKYRLTVQAGTSLTSREISSPEDNQTANALVNLRNNSERSLETSHIRILCSAHHKSGLEIASGLQLTQINEVYNSLYSISGVDTIYGIKYFTQHLDGNIDTIYGNIPVERTTSFQKRYFNRYRIIDIPIIVGYRFSTKHKWQASVQAGIFANLQLRTKGKISSLDGQNIELNNNLFRSQIGWSYHLGGTIDYPVSKRLLLSMTVSYHHYINSFTQPNYELEQRYKTLGIFTGLKYNLNYK